MSTLRNGIVCLLTAITVFPCAAAQRPPNVIIILADDLGYGDLSCYGGSTPTPHLDRLAAEGLRFTDFHSSGAVCSPTRAGLLTGRYQQRAGIPEVIFADPKRNRHHGLQPTEVTLSRLLKSAGYATGIVGKWHLGYERQYNPLRHGFDFFRGYVSGNIDYISHLDATGVHDWWDGERRVEEPGYVTHLITRHAVKFIDRHKDQPFFLYISHEAVHYPYQGPDDPPERGPGNRVDFRPGDTATRRPIYQRMLKEMDDGVGQVLDGLRRNGLDERTLVFFFSDNGGVPDLAWHGPFRGHKGSVWEGGHRVPGIARWAGRIKPGVSDELAISLDLMPTVLELAGISPPDGRQLDGMSLVPLLLDGKSLGERALFWQHGPRSAMRDGPWKLVVGPPREPGLALYHLGDDPGEQRDLAAEHPDRVTRMAAAIEQWRRDVAEGATVQTELPAGE